MSTTNMDGMNVQEDDFQIVFEGTHDDSVQTEDNQNNTQIDTWKLLIEHEASLDTYAADQEKKGGKPDKSQDKADKSQDKANKSQDKDDKSQEIDSDLTVGDMLTLIYAEITEKRIAGHHIDSMNAFNQVGIKQIATKVFTVEGRQKNLRDKTPEDQDIAEIAFKVEFTEANLTSPTTVKYKSGAVQALLPNMARIKGLTYSAQLMLDATITATATYKSGGTKVKTAEIKNHRIASIPCMVGTELCHTAICSRDTLKHIEEDPRNSGGHYIINGIEWVIDNLENITNNTFHVYKNMYGNEIVRGTFLSKPGDAFENSYQLILRYLNNGAITIEITTNKFNKFELPYYVLFRALGMSRDRDIINNIVYGVDQTDPITREMLQILDTAFTVDDAKFGPILKTTEPAEIVRFIAQKITDTAQSATARRDENITKYLNASILNIFDRFIFPHIGTGIEHRIRKLRFLGHLINKLLSVKMGIIDQTDRDDYRNKRIYAAGTSYAKAFKTDFNFAVVQAIKRQLNKDFKTTPFSGVQLADSFRAAINYEDLERLLTQAITTGNKKITVRRTEIINRISSQTLYRKNDMNVMSTMRTINTPNPGAAKQTSRADEMRRVQPSYTGYIDLSQSADSGEKVGLTKQMASTASICGPTSSWTLKQILLADTDILPLDDVAPERIMVEELAKVFVNGDWIGCCRKSYMLVAKYRLYRRMNVPPSIHHLTTIVWEPLIREVYFWTDVGRMMRPLTIVYNNVEEYVTKVRAGNKDFQFKQWIKLTKDHIRQIRAHKLTMEDLRRQGVIEYISPEEQGSAYLSPNLTILRKHVNDITHQYTHMDIDQALFGIVTLAGPMANHSNAVRNTMYTNHRKQSAGWFAMNWPYLMLRGATLQHYCERPLVSTFSDSLTCPNGMNTIVALMLHGGENCEDSIKVNQSSVDCGAYQASFYNYERADLDKGEQFGNPDYARTMDIKKDAIYEHINGGFIAEGTLIKKGYVLVVKAAKIPRPDTQFIYVDKSVVYKRDEQVYVERVISTRNNDDVQIAKVKFRADRPMAIGDKFCLSPDHEVLTTRGWTDIALITLEDKIACLVNGKLEYAVPSEVQKFHHTGEMYNIDTDYVSQYVTLNHKMLVSTGKPSYSANVQKPKKYTLKPVHDILMEQAIYFKKNCINDMPDAKFYTTDDELLLRNPAVLSAQQANALRKRIIGDYTNIVVRTRRLADNISRLAFQCGLSALITYRSGSLMQYRVKIHFTDDENEPCVDMTRGKIQDYNGDVYCVTVPGNVFYVRRNGVSSWTGNSSRSGNKGICAILVPRHDMPFCPETGLTPDLIVNAHSIPTRMAVNQITECVLAQLCTFKGTFADATPFRPQNIMEAVKELESYGVKYGGHRRLYNGMTGVWIDTHIFIGPTTYQRLQKFVVDENYAIKNGPTSALTHQPLDGKNNDGGLRLGEMEKDCLSVAGVMRALFGKFYDDSDGIVLPICRLCGNRAIVNEKMGIYKCKTCGDRADIVNVDSAWVANVFFHESSSMNIKLKFGLEPFKFSQNA